MDTLKQQSNGPLYSNTGIGTLPVDRPVGCYIWYSEGRAAVAIFPVPFRIWHNDGSTEGVWSCPFVLSWFRLRRYAPTRSASVISTVADVVTRDVEYDVIRRLRAQRARDLWRQSLAGSAAVPGLRCRARLPRPVRHVDEPLCQLGPMYQWLRHSDLWLLRHWVRRTSMSVYRSVLTTLLCRCCWWWCFTINTS